MFTDISVWWTIHLTKKWRFEYIKEATISIKESLTSCLLQLEILFMVKICQTIRDF